MSVMCCERCSYPTDTDFHVEVCRYGFRWMGQGLVKTDNDNDCVTLCDSCFEGFGFEEE